jgi:hypothetical protein
MEGGFWMGSPRATISKSSEDSRFGTGAEQIPLNFPQFQVGSSDLFTSENWGNAKVLRPRPVETQRNSGAAGQD